MSGGRFGSGTLGIAGRLAALLVTLAAMSTAIALLLQDRALDGDLRQAARARLGRGAVAADRLMAEHLRTLAIRYAAITRTPEFRANLQTRHAETLSFYASRLLEGQGATFAGFLDTDGRFIARAGDPRLTGPAAGRADIDQTGPRGPCVAARDGGPARSEPRWAPCEYPGGGAEATLFRSGRDLYALVVAPLRTGDRLDGGFLAVEPVDQELLGRWSELSGARIRLAVPGDDSADLVATVREFPGFGLVATTTYGAERAIIRRARTNLVVSGLLAICIALGASLFMARGFARPILEMREATARLSSGRLEERVEVRREDELGELGLAFNQLASQLTESREKVRRAQRLARFASFAYDFEAARFEGTDEFRRLVGAAGSGPLDLADLLDGVRPEDRIELEEKLRDARWSLSPFRLDLRVRGAGGRDRILHLRVHSRTRASERLQGSVQDVTERRTAEEQIRYLALHDSLTGLGNRDFTLRELSHRVEHRADGPPFAVVVLGLDDLRSVVHTFGHAVGDRLLVDVANRLVVNVRERPRGGAGGGSDLVTRLGDDRFAIVLDGGATPDDIESTAKRLIGAASRPYRAGRQEVLMTPSIGVALWPADSESPETLLRNAETALSLVQREEPGGVRFFHASMREDASRRLQIAHGLRHALQHGGLELHYQPRIRVSTGETVALEGLARWTDPDLGPVSPAEFIPISEATGTIHALGTWCIQTAAAKLRQWHENGHGGIGVSVNLSRLQLRPELVPTVLGATEGLDRSRFELEVTESALIEEGDAAIETLTALRGLGFRIALDDFGTGYSSLSYLQGLPIDTVKVDRGFIREIAEDPDAAALTGSVLAMCRALRLHTVVEGVETRAQLEVLERLGCEEVQGFLFSRPLPPDQAESFLDRASTAEA